MTMKTGKINLWSFVLTMVFLYIGAFIAGFIVPMFAANTGYWSGIFTGVIQVLILSVFGVFSKKMGFVELLTGGIVIFVGGILGSMAAGYLSFTGIYATVLILAIQTMMLLFTGFLKGGGGKPKLGR